MAEEEKPEAEKPEEEKRDVRGHAQRILDTARRHFERFGYRRANIAEISREAGVSPGTIYRYFENKEHLLREVIEADRGQWLAMADDVLHGPGNAAERLIRLGAQSVEFYKQNRLLAAVVRGDTDIIFAPMIQEMDQYIVDANVSTIAQMIREGIEEGTMRAVDDPEKAAFILYMAGGALFDQQHLPYEGLLPVFADIVSNGLIVRSE